MTESLKKKRDELAKEHSIDGFHGCLTGDCPHSTVTECYVHIFNEGFDVGVEVMSGERNQAKSDLSVRNQEIEALKAEILTVREERGQAKLESLKGEGGDEGQD